jgi:arylsulfatase A-like enzyme
LVRARDALDAADLRYVVDLFDEELAHTDRHVGRLLDELDRRDLWRDTLVVLVVDHGEQFLDHGGFEHTVNVFEELVHVPLVIVPPGSTRGTRFAGVVETRDVFATVLDELDVDFAPSVRPRNLLRAAASAPAPDARAFTITWPEDAQPAWGVRSFVSGLRTPHFKAIHDWTRERRMLFDLASDPREQRDVSAEHLELAAELARELDLWTQAQRSSSSGAASADLDAAGVRMLQALGYMGGGH